LAENALLSLEIREAATVKNEPVTVDSPGGGLMNKHLVWYRRGTRSRAIPPKLGFGQTQIIP